MHINILCDEVSIIQDLTHTIWSYFSIGRTSQYFCWQSHQCTLVVVLAASDI